MTSSFRRIGSPDRTPRGLFHDGYHDDIIPDPDDAAYIGAAQKQNLDFDEWLVHASSLESLPLCNVGPDDACLVEVLDRRSPLYALKAMVHCYPTSINA